MALRFADRILETTTTTGTGALALAGAITSYRRFSAIPSISTNDTVYYSIFAVDANGNPNGDWEVGLGTYSAANELTRTTPSASTNAGAAVNFGAGTKWVMATPTAAFIGTPPTEHIEVALSDMTTALTTGDGKAAWFPPYNFTLTEVFTGLAGAQSSSGSVTIDARYSGSTIFTTPPSIEAGEDTSLTGTPAVLSVTALTKGVPVLFDIDAAGTGAKGLLAVLIGNRT